MTLALMIQVSYYSGMLVLYYLLFSSVTTTPQFSTKVGMMRNPIIFKKVEKMQLTLLCSNRDTDRLLGDHLVDVVLCAQRKLATEIACPM
jgi:hypothetical protein